MVSGDEEVKLLLEAFQMSVSSCLSHPQTPVLRAQMLGRLMAVELSRSVKVQCPVHSPADAQAILSTLEQAQRSVNWHVESTAGR